jgi:hypothetical protein
MPPWQSEAGQPRKTAPPQTAGPERRCSTSSFSTESALPSPSLNGVFDAGSGHPAALKTARSHQHTMRCLTVLEIAHCNAVAFSWLHCLERFDFDSDSSGITHIVPGAVRAPGLHGDYFAAAAA